MTHSYRVHYFHLIWSTKNRIPWIEGKMQTRLYSYLGGIIKNYKAKSHLQNSSRSLFVSFHNFSVSFSELEKVQNYIQSQETHHANQTFDQEYLKFLKQNKISYDDRFVLG